MKKKLQIKIIKPITETRQVIQFFLKKCVSIKVRVETSHIGKIENKESNNNIQYDAKKKIKNVNKDEQKVHSGTRSK